MRRVALPLFAALTLGSCREPTVPVGFGQELVLEALSPLEQPADLNARLTGSAVPRVRVVDERGTPVPKVPVLFVVTRGRPTLTTIGTRTHDNGELGISEWRTGTQAGIQEVTAILALNSSDTRVTFRVLVSPGPAVSIDLNLDSVVVAVGDTSASLVFTSRDAFGNVVDTIESNSFTSDAPGIAEVTASGAVRAMAPGRTVVAAEYGTMKSAVLVVSGGVSSRQAVTIPSYTGEGYALATAPSGLGYAVAFWTGEMHRIAAGAQVATTVPWTGSSAGIVDGVFAPDESHIYFIAAEENQIFVHSVAEDSVVHAISVPHRTQRIAITPDGSYLIATGTSQFTRVAVGSWGQESFPLAWTPAGEVTNGVVVHPSATTVYVSNTGGSVAALDYLTGTVLQVVYPGNRPQGLALDLSRNRLLVAREQGPLRILDAGTLQHLFDGTPGSTLYDVRYDPVTDATWGTRPTGWVLERYSQSLARAVEQISVPEARRIGIRPDGSILVSANGGVRLILPP